MARGSDDAKLLEELVELYHEGDEAKARALVSRLGARPRKARALLEGMLNSPDARERQAAAFGLGELGGATHVALLERQLVLEEARGDLDGASVVEAITQALARLEEAGARASLVRRLRRLTVGKPDSVEVDTLAGALWLKRHPELLPALQQSLEQLALPAPTALHGLRVLLEKSPEELGTWAGDMSVPVEYKSAVLTVLAEEVPDAWVPILRAFLSTAESMVEKAASQKGVDSLYCEGLLSLLLRHKERLLPLLPPEAIARLRAVARVLVAAASLRCAVRAAAVLQHVGQSEDISLLEAHRPAEPILAKVFDDAVEAVRKRLNT